MTNEIQLAAPMSAIEKVVVGNDLSALKPEERWAYYRWRCESLGLDPAARPFQYIVFQGKLTLYADKGCAEQLRAKHRVTIKLDRAQVVDGIYMQPATAYMPDGRSATDIGAVPVAGLRGDDLAKAMKKAVTQANRRVTLALMGLGSQDLEGVEGVQVLDINAVHNPAGLLPNDAPQPESKPHEGKIDWKEDGKWPGGALSECVATVRSVTEKSNAERRWLVVSVDDGEKDITLSTFHMSAKPVFDAATGKRVKVMYAKKERGNQLLSMLEIDDTAPVELHEAF